jgi:hypothetical protein
MNPPLIEEIIKKYYDQWNDCAEGPDQTLLRISILRELIKTFHSEKSRFLARGLKTEAQLIKSYEAKIHLLRDLPKLPDPLRAMIQDPIDEKTCSKKKRLLPELLFQSISREKLTRYDRSWEAIIAAEATSLSWTFWHLEAWVEIHQIEEWDQTLQQKLWPHGLVLFTENAQSETPTVNDSSLWQGRWFIGLHPHFKNPQELSLNLEHWPGFPETPPTKPHWELLYP